MYLWNSRNMKPICPKVYLTASKDVPRDNTLGSVIPSYSASWQSELIGSCNVFCLPSVPSLQAGLTQTFFGPWATSHLGPPYNQVNIKRFMLWLALFIISLHYTRVIMTTDFNLTVVANEQNIYFYCEMQRGVKLYSIILSIWK